MQRRLINYLKGIEYNIELMIFFSIKYGFKMLVLGLVPRKIKEKYIFFKKIEDNTKLTVKNYLKKNYYDKIKNNNYNKNFELITNNSTIWIFWWQGIESAPEIVQKCVKSIYDNRRSHSVVILDSNNYNKYVSFPDYIEDKFKRGMITLTHFSDLLRSELLYNYGGIWMDATIYMTHPFDAEIYTKNFYTINFNGEKNCVINLGSWTSFFLAANKNNYIIGMLRDLFFEYWKNENILIVYLLIDYFLTIMYEENSNIKKEIDSIPISNKDIFKLCNILNDEKKSFQFLDKSTYLFKLTYKKTFVEYINGKETVYHYILNDRQE